MADAQNIVKIILLLLQALGETWGGRILLIVLLSHTRVHSVPFSLGLAMLN